MNHTEKSASDKLHTFDPNGVGNTLAGIFGLPFSADEARLVVIPVPWEVSVSNNAGTAKAPGLIFKHSSQIDLYDEFARDAWKAGISMDAFDDGLARMNTFNRLKALEIIAYLESGHSPANDPKILALIDEVNEGCRQMTSRVCAKATSLLLNNQIPFILGGDHSVPLGAIQATAAAYPGLGVLQIDAHADLRKSYQGFTYSHASIMRNVADLDDVGEIVQVGIREYCDEEIQFVESRPDKMYCFTDRDIYQQLFRGNTWAAICHEIIDSLPQKVYVSFDIDGLDPAFCPNTGTPVPGGLSYNQAMYLLETLVESGRTIVGADLVETGAHDFDAMMAVRVLYKMCGMAIRSNG